jgi:hypothetical protein
MKVRAILLPAVKRLVILLPMFSACFGQGVTEPPPLSGEFLARQKAEFQRILEQDGLSSKLEVVRLHLGDHPDGNDDRRSFRLELSFAATGTQQDADAQFQKFVESHSAGHRNRFLETWFYKLVHSLDVDRRFASVHFVVLDAEYAVYFDRSTEALTLRRGENRSVRLPLTVEPPQGRDPAPRERPAGQPSTMRPDAAKAIQQFLDQYYAAANKTGRAGVNSVHWKLPEAHYLEMSVSGLRHHAIRSHDYWEKLKISVVIVPEGRNQDLMCYFDGWYATGLGARPPAEDSYHAMDDKSFGGELESYAEDLLRDMKRYLEQDH